MGTSTPLPLSSIDILVGTPERCKDTERKMNPIVEISVFGNLETKLTVQETGIFFFKPRRSKEEYRTE